MAAGPALELGELSGRDTSVGAIERQLASLRYASARDGGALRTSVLTHVAWVPPEWDEAAHGVLEGLAERHPSRVILLLPELDADEDGIDADVSLQCFRMPGQEQHVCSEVIELRLRGARAVAPASIVTPLFIPDLPVFLRWRGRPRFGETSLDGLLDAVDRLVVDSAEWPDVPAAYGELAAVFDRAAVSDIAWRRTLRWRHELARMWPEIAEARRLAVTGPLADALLLRGWLRDRLDAEFELDHERADTVQSIAVDGEPVPVPRGEPPSASDLLSDELDQFGRDRIYERAAIAAAGAEATGR